MSETVTIIKEWKKYRRYQDGADYYGISKSSFERLAKAAGAIYKINRVTLVNCEIIEQFIETCKIVP